MKYLRRWWYLDTDVILIWTGFGDGSWNADYLFAFELHIDDGFGWWVRADAESHSPENYNEAKPLEGATTVGNNQTQFCSMLNNRFSGTYSSAMQMVLN